MSPAEQGPAPRPFIKWPGGKWRLRHTLAAALPSDVARRRWVEPFAGGAAMFFAQRPQRALLCDVNADLIATYCSVRDDVEAVVVHLQRLASGHRKERYYALRKRHNDRRAAMPPAERASLFIYLNKACFNGLYRVNKRGEFNVPMGRYANPAILDADGLVAASRALAGVDIRAQRAAVTCDAVGEGDFVYLDPPYDPISRTSNFTAYSSEGFGDADQRHLRDMCMRLGHKGAKFMISNSNTPFIRELYRGFYVTEITATRSIGVKSRGTVRELVICNYTE